MTYPVHVFAGDPLDRADALRRDESWIQARLAREDSRFLTFDELKVLAERGPPTALSWVGPAVLSIKAPGAAPLFLGTRDDTAYFGLDVSGNGERIYTNGASPHAAFEDARNTAAHLSIAQSGTLAHAKSLVDWHARHGFCANCGARTAAHFGGKERICSGCGAHHYPRTDPVAIMLVHHGDRCLLGRSRRRVTKLYSALAGFVDQGESIEGAVRREVWEEAGIRVGAVRYHSSQPWPFPASLMIGCLAEAISTEIVVDEHELADVQWFDRETVRKVLDKAPDAARELELPGRIAIAHHLIRAWIAPMAG
ncbi:MAG: NAD(+) diphosphatase [Gammaproteobacteria bacterium]|nr:NAD(+) diphosphatase [Gammaproteobacteria bacterium]